MRADRYAELLTAYVDGELSTRQRKAVQRLLQKSAEARALLRQLQADAECIRQLPRPRLRPDFPLRVMQVIAERGLTPAGRPAAPRPRRLPAWVGWATAAAVLLSVGVLSYFAFPLLHTKERRGTPMAHRPHGIDPGQPSSPDSQKKPKADSTPNRVVQAPRDRDPREPLVNVADRKPDKKPVRDQSRPSGKDSPPPRRDPRDLLGSEDKPDLPPIVAPKLSLIRPLQELGHKPYQDRLLARLKEDDGIKIQLLCRDPAKGLAQLHSVLAAHGIELLIDPPTQERLKNRRLGTTVVLYTENLAPAELAAIIENLGRADLDTTRKNWVPLQYGEVVVMSLAQRFRKHFTDVVGPPLAAQLPPAPRRLALVLGYNEGPAHLPVNPNWKTSKAVQQFRANRKGRASGTLQVMLVLSRGI